MPVADARQTCNCQTSCGDDGDTEGPGICKGLPTPPLEPLVKVVMVPRNAVPRIAAP